MRLVTGIVLALHLLATHARRKRAHKQLKFSDCSTDADRAVKVLSMDAHPMPVASPGSVRLAAAINITRTLPKTLSLDITLSKFFFGYPFKLPCFANQIGTCAYKDICSYLSHYEVEGCPHLLNQHCLPCTCPFKAGIYSFHHLHFRVPKLDGLVAVLAKGDYEGVIRLTDDRTRKEIMCVKLAFSMRRRRRHKGWFFK